MYRRDMSLGLYMNARGTCHRRLQPTDLGNWFLHTITNFISPLPLQLHSLHGTNVPSILVQSGGL